MPDNEPAFTDRPEFKTQAAEFDAVAELVQLWRTQPDIVEDDYPEWRHRYESCVNNRLIPAFKANLRIPEL